MNRFLTYAGRQPIWLDDFNFIQDTLDDEIKKIIQGIIGLNYDYVILTGCEKSISEDGLIRISEGVMYFKGDIVRVQEATFTIESNFKISLDEEYDPAGDRTLISSGEEVSCYRIRKASIYVPRQSSKHDTNPSVSSTIRLKDIIKKMSSSEVIFTGRKRGYEVKLVRQNGTYLLSGYFRYIKETDASVVFPVENNDVSGDLCVSYNWWNTYKNVSDPWSIGEHLGSCTYTYEAPDGDIKYASAMVVIRTLSAHPDYPSIPWVLEVELQGLPANVLNAVGGFTIMLNNINQK